MILRLVERRRKPEPLGESWNEEGFLSGALARLAAGMGRAGWGCDVVLVDDEIMAGLNEEFRSMPGVTDVLSFSYLQDGGSGPADLERGRGEAAADLWLDALAADRDSDRVQTVGEVVLAPRFIIDRCAARDWPEEQEVPLLVVHGLLHILGWDHRDEEETKAMREAEAAILAREDFPHPLLDRS